MLGFLSLHGKTSCKMLRQKSVAKSVLRNFASGTPSWLPSKPDLSDPQSRHAQLSQSPHPYPNLQSQSKSLSQSKKKRSSSPNLLERRRLSCSHGCQRLCDGIEYDDHRCLYIGCAFCRLCWVDEFDPTPEEAYLRFIIDEIMEGDRVRHRID